MAKKVPITLTNLRRYAQIANEFNRDLVINPATGEVQLLERSDPRCKRQNPDNTFDERAEA
jgi:hypothetical protein